MKFVILGFFVLVVAMVVSTPALIALGFFIKKRSWTIYRKQAVFIAAGTFLTCPVLIPAGTISAIMLPNWIACGLFLWSDPKEILGIPLWYAKGWHIHLPFLLATAVLMTGIAKMVFFIPPRKSTETSDNLPL